MHATVVDRVRWTWLSGGLLVVLLAGRPAVGDEGPIAALQAGVQRAIAKARPALVMIYVLDREQLSPQRGPTQDDPGNPNSLSFRPDAVGSGIVLDPETILTCWHVVRSGWQDPERTIIVRTFTGARKSATILAADPRSDLATLRIKADKELPTLTIADGEKLFIGQFVAAVGNPFGVGAADGSSSASFGIISNVRRRAVPGSAIELRERSQPSESKTTQSLHLWTTLVQTDARLNTGSSGGALVNLEGELVGVTLALSASIGFDAPGGFALPTNRLTRRLIQSLREGKECEYGFLGISPQTVGTDQANPSDIGGCEVARITPYTPTSRSELRRGDIIVQIDDQPIRSVLDLVQMVGSLPVDYAATLRVRRGGQEQTFKVTLSKYPVEGEIVVTHKRPSWNGIRVDHLSTLSVRGLNFGPRIGAFEEPSVTGVAIREVEKNSRADRAGIRAGEVLSAIDGQPVRHPDDFDKLAPSLKLPITLTIADRPYKLSE